MSKAPAKRSQYLNATYGDIVGCNLLRAFGHHDDTCCDVLRHVGCCWLKFETGQIFHATFVDVAWCCSRLAGFGQQCCARACAQVWFSTRNMSQYLATCWPNACNNVGICCVEMLRSFGRGLKLLGQQCCDMLHWTVAIVWLGLKGVLHNMQKVVISRTLSISRTSEAPTKRS